MEYWYRYYDQRYAPTPDYDGERRGRGSLEVHLMTFQVLKHTPKGVWLNLGYTHRFVRLEARKRYACPSKAEALASFIARKHAQKRILEGQLETVHEALVKAKFIQLVEHMS